MKLLNIDANAKTVKGQKHGYLTGILYLAPAKLSGFEVCPQRSPGCTKVCLNIAGYGRFDAVQKSRIRKTQFYFNDRDAFMAQLVKEIKALIRKAGRMGLIPVVRLNGTSDIPWERIPINSLDPNEGQACDPRNIFEVFPDLTFYDYSKVTKRALAHARGDMPKNYHITFSKTEDNDKDVFEVLKAGGNVAVVFNAKEALPPNLIVEGGDSIGWRTLRIGHANTGHLEAYEVIDGDTNDLRFLDKKNVIVGLKAKGEARHDTSGFVIYT